MCDCSACRTGKCGCRQCRPGPGIDFRGGHALADELRADIARERLRVRDLRAPSIERQQVRRWGDSPTTRGAISAETSMFRQEERNTGDEENADE